MIGWLSQLVNNFVCWIETGIAFVFNGVVAGLGLLGQGALFLLPSMPGVPSVPASVQQGFAWGNYWFPVGFLVTTIAAIFALELTLWVVGVLLRWSRVIG
jgi:hypothetical protein